MIELSDYDRIPELIPIRHFRMTKSPLVFYRATASLMAGDLSFTNSTGINIQISGDCHLMNFGCFSTPERSIVADINDFDETNPGPWEWDLKRLATSFVLAARANKISGEDSRDIVMKLVTTYQEKMNIYARMNFLEFWYTRFTLGGLRKLSENKKIRDEIEEMLKKAEDQSGKDVLYKLATNKDAGYVIAEKPPLIYHPFNMDKSREVVKRFMENYKNSLQPDRRLLLDQYRVEDIALKVVGVGSVGTRCFVVLLMNDNDEPVFVQVKEARQSVLENYTGPVVSAILVKGSCRVSGSCSRPVISFWAGQWAGRPELLCSAIEG
jgi:uncharacterized protein (DUF2252 family)